MSCCVSRRRVGLEVGQELAVDGIRDPPLQTPQGFPAGLALALLARHIGAAGMVAAGLGDGHDIQGPVQPAVAATVQPMPLEAPRGGRDRGGAVGRGELTTGASNGVMPFPAFGQLRRLSGHTLWLSP